jgi:uncharacterized repeat protein (TIGR02059 family)
LSTTSRRSLKRAAAGVSAGVLTLSGFAAIAVPATAQSTFALTRQAGADRYATAAQIATSTFGTADNVLIASGETGHYADALTGNFLAGSKGAPVLLTTGKTLSPAAKDALATLKAKNVTILGGEAAVSKAVADALTAAGYTVNRLGGNSRYETSKAIAEAGGTVGSLEGKGNGAIVASGLNFPDALVAGGLAFAGKLPVEITDPNKLSTETSDSLTSKGIKHVAIIGGNTAVSPAVEAAIVAKGITVTRLQGGNRYLTATAVANYATGVSGLGFSKSLVDLATGADFADALVGGPSAGKDKAPLVLAVSASTLGADTTKYLTDNSATLTGGKVFGGQNAVSDAAVTAAQNAGRTAPASNQTYSVTPNGAATGQTFSTADDTNTTADESKQGNRAYTVTGLDDTKTYNVALFPAANVTANGGQISFADTEPQTDGTKGNGVADWTATNTQIISVNNAPTGDNNGVVLAVTPVNGVVKFTINATQADKVVPVVFRDTAAGGTTSTGDAPSLNVKNGLPTDEFGVGAETDYTAPAAANTANTTLLTVTSVNKATRTLVAGSGAAARTYSYDSGDQYNITGNSPSGVTFSAFEAALSSGDQIQAQPYYADPSLTSVWTLTDVAPAVTATATEGTGSKSNEVTVAVTPVNPSTPASYSSFVIQRANGVSPVAADWATIATITPAQDADGDNTNGVQYLDKAVAAGTYSYRVAGVVDGDQGVYSTPDTAVSTTPAADTTAPLAIDTIQSTTGGLAGTLDAGDVVKFVYNETIAAPAAGSKIRVEDQDGPDSIGDLINGTNATFALNTAAETVNGVSRAAGRVLTVTLTSDPTVVTAGYTAGLQYNSYVIDASGIKDTAGNTWNPNVNGQDVQIESTGTDTQNDSTDTSAPVQPTGITPATPTTVNADNATIGGIAEPGSTVKVFRAGTQVASGAANASTGAFSIVAPLTQNATNDFTVRAYDAANNQGAQAAVPTITEDSNAPTLSNAAVSGSTLTITYNEPLDSTSVPANGDFAVTNAGTANPVTTVAVTGSTVVLTLTNAPTTGQAVLLNYTKGTNPIQDKAGNDAANVVGRSVTNSN